MGKFDAKTGLIDLRIVYFGPSAAGKSTNLRRIRSHWSSSGAPGSWEERAVADGTEFVFRSAPLDLSLPRPLALRVEVCTVSGASSFVASQRQLADADGIVFVADCDRDRLRDNLVAWADLHEQLRTSCLDARRVPVVVQYNKIDLSGGRPSAELEATANPDGFPAFSASAKDGTGVGRCFSELLRRMVARAHTRFALDMAGVGRGPLASCIDSALTQIGAGDTSALRETVEDGQAKEEEPARQEPQPEPAMTAAAHDGSAAPNTMTEELRAVMYLRKLFGLLYRERQSLPAPLVEALQGGAEVAVFLERRLAERAEAVAIEAVQEAQTPTSSEEPIGAVAG